MRRWRRWAEAAGAMLLASACAAQGSDGAEGSHADNEQHPQNLTVWIVRPVTAAEHAVQRAQNDLRDISVYRESTAGNFGKSASDAGQTAGSYGKNASDVGKNASDVGTNAGDYGQTASSLPSNVKSQTAGSYGTTAGNFGTTASEFSGVTPRTALPGDSTATRDSKGAQWPAFLSKLHSAFPGMDVRFVEVNAAELRERLAAVGAGAIPDVLLTDRMPDWWASGSRGSVLVALRGGAAVIPGERRGPRQRQTVFHDAYGLAAAPHPVAAREFLLWWSGEESAANLRIQRMDGKQTPPMSVALSAVAEVLGGSPLDGFADKDMAVFSSVVTDAETLGPAERVPSDLRFRTEVVRAQNNDRLAVVLLHAQCVSRTAYCDLYPVVMLRANERGEWKVLHLSLAMDGRDAALSFAMVGGSAQPAKTLAEVSLPKLASPVDGDQRASVSGLDLWWDNGGGASLLVVEWQVGSGRTAPASHVFLVSDTEAKAQTQVPAPFVNVGGPIRWRVWAVGQGGVVRLTQWRTVTMVQ